MVFKPNLFYIVFNTFLNDVRRLYEWTATLVFKLELKGIMHLSACHAQISYLLCVVRSTNGINLIFKTADYVRSSFYEILSEKNLCREVRYTFCQIPLHSLFTWMQFRLYFSRSRYCSDAIYCMKWNEKSIDTKAKRSYGVVTDVYYHAVLCDIIVRMVLRLGMVCVLYIIVYWCMTWRGVAFYGMCRFVC